MVQALVRGLVLELEEQLVPVRSFVGVMVSDNYSPLAV